VTGRDAGAPAPFPLPEDCEVDQGPPVRVAFVWGGILDNWQGIVYDPTGVVLTEKGHLLFGGDLIHARHLWKDWYYCAFT
jgi:hypothetical protein